MISQKKFNGRLVDIQWCGEENNQTSIFVLTSKGNILLSNDKGNTFNSLSSLLISLSPRGTKYTSEKDAVSSLIRSIVDPQMFILLG